MNFKNIFKDKKVLITGHTGFKGSWLSLWLSQLGSNIYGISLSVPTKPSHFENLSLNLVEDIRIDIADSDEVINLIKRIKPDFVFHLAAQPIVGISFTDPLLTFKSNTLGTTNILEALRISNHKCISVIITSDKSYDNIEVQRGYNENDRLGGADPYSGSKGAAELIIKSYIKSFFSVDGVNRIGIGRAGNVIGGGDWADGRIIPDVIRSLKKTETLNIRSPEATRPWQHVLEPISGYLALAHDLYESKENHGEAFNFGPSFSEDYTVLEVLKELKTKFSSLEWKVDENSKFKESTLLKLDCKKARLSLNWSASLNFKETIEFTADWYSKFLLNDKNLNKFSRIQIEKYCKKEKEKKVLWAIK